MNAHSERALADRQQALCEQLHTQRRLIARQLGPDAAAQGSEFPRSMTMRFLTRRPNLALLLLGRAATLFVGARLANSASFLLSATRRQ